MGNKCTASYEWRDRIKGSQRLELLDDRYLRITEQRPSGNRRFGIDLACLSSTIEPVTKSPKHWLGLSLLLGLTAAGLGYYLTQNKSPVGLPVTASAILIPSLLAVFFMILYRRNSVRGHVLRTRHARFPIITIEAPGGGDVKTLAPFLEKIRISIERVENSESLSPDVLRSGEIRTLRRLANEAVINEDAYETAKLQIFQAG